MSHSCSTATLSALRRIPSAEDLPSTAKQLLRSVNGGAKHISQGSALDAAQGAVLFALLCCFVALLLPTMTEGLAVIACFAFVAAPVLYHSRAHVLEAENTCSMT